MSVKLLTEHHLEFLRLNGGCTGSSESTLFKMPNCWKSRVAAQIFESAKIMNFGWNICLEHQTVIPMNGFVSIDIWHV